MLDKILDSFEAIFENTVVRMIIALMLVGILSGAALVFVYTTTKPQIEKNLNKAKEQAIYSIFKGADKIEAAKLKGVWKVMDDSGKVIGYAFTSQGNGYQGIIQMMAGIDPQMQKMHGMEVLESQETPGLGAEIAGDKFRDQFNGLSVAHPIEYLKNEKPTQPYQIEAITGATISSRAVVNILNKRIEEIKKDIKG